MTNKKPNIKLLKWLVFFIDLITLVLLFVSMIGIWILFYHTGINQRWRDLEVFRSYEFIFLMITTVLTFFFKGLSDYLEEEIIQKHYDIEKRVD